MAENNDKVSEENNVAETNNGQGEVKADDKPVKNTATEETTEKSSKSNEDSEQSSESNESAEKSSENNKDTEKSNENTESDKEPSAELLKKIKNQVEFYFGDVNMQRDRFLIEQTKLDEGWVPMNVMLNFKILASLSKNIEVILKALEGSELIEISEDKKKIRRSPEKPLPVFDDNYRKAQEARTIYLKGFPTDSTIDMLKEYFESYTDSIENIIMRKYKKGKEYFFKGSIFLQFKTLDDAKAYMAQESVKYKDTELIKLWSADYTTSKEKEKDERRQKKLNKGQNNAKNDDKSSKNKKNNAEEKTIKLPKGCIIHISGVNESINRDQIKQKLIELEGEVAYIDFNKGDTAGWVRLQGENSAVNFVKKLDSNTIKVQDCDITCKVLEGEEEETYLTKIQENMASAKANRYDRGRNMRRGNKRRHSPHRDGNAKRANVDDS